MTSENPVRARGVAPAMTRLILTVALAAAVIASAASAAFGVADVVTQAASGRVPVALFSGAALPPDDVRGRLVEGTWRTADLVVRDVPGGTAAIGVAADVAGLTARLALGSVLVLLLVSVLRRTPFGGRTAVPVTIAGGVVAIAALLQVGLGTLRDWMIADLLTQGGSGTWPAQSVFDPTLLVVGFGIMVVGLLLAHGAELQRDTDGLV